MKKILNYLYDYKSLSREQAKEVLINISEGVYNETELASFITVFLMRTISVNELNGFRDALAELCVNTDLGEGLLDIAGTGGDSKNTFNISTLSSFIAAGAGARIAKHGNYGFTSVSGSSDLMKELGYEFTSDTGKLKAQIERAGICFLHAPLFHPALKIAGPVRKQLGIRTFFNMLGPLINPAHPQYRMIGVYSQEMARLYNYILQEEGCKFTIVHSMDGYDEISLTADTKIITEEGEQIISAEVLGKRTVQPSDIYGGSTVRDAAALFNKILKGEGTWAQNAVVITNAAVALNTTGKFLSYDDCYLAAVESLESKKAYNCLKKLIA